MCTINILLSTCNGEKYLPELFESLEKQTIQDFCVLIRDDSSTDRTWNILSDCKNKYRLNIKLYKDRSKRGVIQSFNYLLQRSDADYVMFCDQDDVWYPRKIEKTLQAAIQFEEINGNTIPVLVHTDLEVVDENLQTVSDSMWEYQKLGGRHKTRLKDLIVQNCITGCTILANRSLVALIGKLPDGILMHDWYLGIVAAAFGKIIPISEPLIKYRQHANNLVGSKSYTLKNEFKKEFGRLKNSIANTFEQTRIFLDQFSEKLDDRDIQLIIEYLSITERNCLHKRLTLIKNGFWKSGFFRNVGLLLFI